MGMAHGARNRSAPAPGRVVKGLSALDLVIEAGELPYTAGPLEFANWLREPVDAIVADLASLVVPIVDAAMVPYMTDINQAVTDAEAAATAAGTSAGTAAASATAAMGYRDQAQTIVDDFEAVAPVAATATEILAGVSSSKYTAPDQLLATGTPNAVTFTATPTPDFTTSQYWKMIQTGNVTSVVAPTGCKLGMTYVLEFLSDASARTLPAVGSWDGGATGAYDWGSLGFPTMVSGANKRNILIGVCYSVSPLKLAISHWKNA